LQNSIGKNYVFNLSKLIKGENTKIDKEQQEKGYFCSEIVAILLKLIEVIPDSKPASSYWPSNSLFNNLKSASANKGICNLLKEQQFLMKELLF